ncbi:hypothetical protein EJ357_28020 [Streptomyces cyaneochromogenes]|uniref:Uncharacterized protein n=1 Tax=Streptomyces cyaneochromogenes TaxID=2496836 RepID=A0A3Q9EVS3_9ACTN|nr:hypothetical protein [Streptomyces cyaneochromogenes]AZQ36821.1 hypothetical protein EJ357_28020 [Streptomyces cyaneochromogenes]
MKFKTRLRSSFAVKSSPFLLGLVLFYYLGDAGPPPQNYGHAPTVVSFPLFYLCAFAYAAASALAAWESGSIRKFGVWHWAPQRSRYRIAAESLMPVVLVSWSMLVLPVSLALVETSTLPTLASLGPLFEAMVLCVAHAVIGFAVGLYLPRSVSAPVLAVTTWIVIAFTISLDPPWLRQISGLCFEYLMFGEALTFSALWPPILLAGGVALAVAVLWMKNRFVAIPVALAILLTGVVVSYNEVKDRGYFPPMATGVTELSCAQSPGGTEVCMPKVTASALPRVARTSQSVLADLRSAGVERSPRLITDSLADGRYLRPSTDRVWRIPLTRAAAQNGERFQIVIAAVGFTCARPDPVLRRAVLEWVAGVTHTEREWQQAKARVEQERSSADAAATSMVQGVHRKTKAQQAKWFEESVHASCRRDG